MVLVLLTNIITMGLVLLFTSSRSPQKKKPTVAHVSNEQPNYTKQVQEKPEQTTKMQIDSIISQYDVIKSASTLNGLFSDGKPANRVLYRK